MVPRHGQGFGGEQPLCSIANPPFGVDPEVGGVAIGLRGVSADPGAAGPALALLPQVGIIGVEDGVVRAFEQAALDGSVSIDAAVSFQMIRGEGGPDADPGTDAVGGFDLVAAEFHHQPIGGWG